MENLTKEERAEIQQLIEIGIATLRTNFEFAKLHHLGRETTLEAWRKVERAENLLRKLDL